MNVSVNAIGKGKGLRNSSRIEKVDSNSCDELTIGKIFDYILLFVRNKSKKKKVKVWDEH